MLLLYDTVSVIINQSEIQMFSSYDNYVSLLVGDLADVSSTSYAHSCMQLNKIVVYIHFRYMLHF